MEDIHKKSTGKIRDDSGREDVQTVIEHVYGYLSLNNMIYGCVTCYDVTYFLRRPRNGTLLISDPIFNSSRRPTLLESLYYFVQLVLVGPDTDQQTLDPAPIISDMPDEDMNTNEPGIQEQQSNSRDSYSCLDHSEGTSPNMYTKNERTKYKLNLDSYHSGTLIGCGATGQVVKLKDSDIMVKHCDSYNNPEGFKMLMREISIYEKLYKLKCKLYSSLLWHV